MSTPEWAWERQSVWSQTADALKAGPERARQGRLVLTVGGAVLALAGTQLEPVNRAAGVGLAIAAAVVIAGAALLAPRDGLERVRDWTRARSVSEALKTEVHLYLTGVGDYAGDDRDARLSAEVDRLENEAGPRLQATAAGMRPKERRLPPVDGLASYLTERVLGSQVERYYRPQAKSMRDRARAFGALRVVLTLAAAALAASTTVSPNAGAWAGVATTAAGAVAAHAAASRYELLWIEYSCTAGELARLADRRTKPNGEPLSAAELVEACENVISVQNQAWMAKWGEETSPDGKE